MVVSHHMGKLIMLKLLEPFFKFESEHISLYHIQIYFQAFKSFKLRPKIQSVLIIILKLFVPVFQGF